MNLCESHVYEVDPSGAPHVGGRMQKIHGSTGAQWSCPDGQDVRFIFPRDALYSLIDMAAYRFHACILVHKSGFTLKKYW